MERLEQQRKKKKKIKLDQIALERLTQRESLQQEDWSGNGVLEVGI